MDPLWPRKHSRHLDGLSNVLVHENDSEDPVVKKSYGINAMDRDPSELMETKVKGGEEEAKTKSAIDGATVDFKQKDALDSFVLETSPLVKDQTKAYFDKKSNLKTTRSVAFEAPDSIIHLDNGASTLGDKQMSSLDGNQMGASLERMKTTSGKSFRNVLLLNEDLPQYANSSQLENGSKAPPNTFRNAENRSGDINNIVEREEIDILVNSLRSVLYRRVNISKIELNEMRLQEPQGTNLSNESSEQNQNVKYALKLLQRLSQDESKAMNNDTNAAETDAAGGRMEWSQLLRRTEAKLMTCMNSSEGSLGAARLLQNQVPQELEVEEGMYRYFRMIWPSASRDLRAIRIVFSCHSGNAKLLVSFDSKGWPKENNASWKSEEKSVGPNRVVMIKKESSFRPGDVLIIGVLGISRVCGGTLLANTLVETSSPHSIPVSINKRLYHRINEFRSNPRLWHKLYINTKKERRMRRQQKRSAFLLDKVVMNVSIIREMCQTHSSARESLCIHRVKGLASRWMTISSAIHAMACFYVRLQKSRPVVRFGSCCNARSSTHFQNNTIELRQEWQPPTERNVFFVRPVDKSQWLSTDFQPARSVSRVPENLYSRYDGTIVNVHFNETLREPLPTFVNSLVRSVCVGDGDGVRKQRELGTHRAPTLHENEQAEECVIDDSGPSSDRHETSGDDDHHDVEIDADDNLNQLRAKSAIGRPRNPRMSSTQIKNNRIRRQQELQKIQSSTEKLRRLVLHPKMSEKLLGQQRKQHLELNLLKTRQTLATVQARSVSPVSIAPIIGHPSSITFGKSKTKP